MRPLLALLLLRARPEAALTRSLAPCSRTDYISLDRVIGILKRHSGKASALSLTKSTTKLEGFLPVEGDELFHGTRPQLEQIREFTVYNRPGSVYSAASERGD